MQVHNNYGPIVFLIIFIIILGIAFGLIVGDRNPLQDQQKADAAATQSAISAQSTIAAISSTREAQYFQQNLSNSQTATAAAATQIPLATIARATTLPLELAATREVERATAESAVALATSESLNLQRALDKENATATRTTISNELADQKFYNEVRSTGSIIMVAVILLFFAVLTFLLVAQTRRREIELQTRQSKEAQKLVYAQIRKVQAESNRLALSNSSQPSHNGSQQPRPAADTNPRQTSRQDTSDRSNGHTNTHVS